jgi:hypothetical protein
MGPSARLPRIPGGSSLPEGYRNGDVPWETGTGTSLRSEPVPVSEPVPKG